MILIGRNTNNNGSLNLYFRDYKGIKCSCLVNMKQGASILFDKVPFMSEQSFQHLPVHESLSTTLSLTVKDVKDLI